MGAALARPLEVTGGAAAPDCNTILGLKGLIRLGHFPSPVEYAHLQEALWSNGEANGLWLPAQVPVLAGRLPNSWQRAVPIWFSLPGAPTGWHDWLATTPPP